MNGEPKSKSSLPTKKNIVSQGKPGYFITFNLPFVYISGVLDLSAGSVVSPSGTMIHGHDRYERSPKSQHNRDKGEKEEEKEELIPSFKIEANTSLTTSAGQPAYFHCLVENLGDREVK